MFAALPAADPSGQHHSGYRLGVGLSLARRSPSVQVQLFLVTSLVISSSVMFGWGSL